MLREIFDDSTFDTDMWAKLDDMDPDDRSFILLTERSLEMVEHPVLFSVAVTALLYECMAFVYAEWIVEVIGCSRSYREHGDKELLAEQCEAIGASQFLALSLFHLIYIAWSVVCLFVAAPWWWMGAVVFAAGFVKNRILPNNALVVRLDAALTASFLAVGLFLAF